MNEPEYRFVKGVGWVPGYEESHTFTTELGIKVTFINREPAIGEYGNYVETGPGSWYYADGKVQLVRLEDWGKRSIYEKGNGEWTGARLVTTDWLERMKANGKAALFTIVVHEPD
jgi:hypothetical protein